MEDKNFIILDFFDAGKDFFLEGDTRSVKIKMNLAIQHIQSAALYARLCGKLERAYNPHNLNQQEFEELLIEHRAHVISAIFASVAFLEAEANWIYGINAERIDRQIEDIFEKGSSSIVYQESDKLILRDMLLVAMVEKDRMPTWKKFNDILTTQGKEGFNLGIAACQDVIQLINLRNALTHYKPTWANFSFDSLTENQVDDMKIEALRKQKKFPLNPLVNSSGKFVPFFPTKCLGYV